LADASQWAAETLLGNQVPETVDLARSARRLGAVAASAFGAGFGGSVWALVEQRACEAFLVQWAGAYRSRFPQHAGASRFFATAAGPPACRVA
jgi:galactokinase